MKQFIVHMKLDDKHEWNFKAYSACNAVIQGRRICQENGFRFPQDVIEWDFKGRK